MGAHRIRIVHNRIGFFKFRPATLPIKCDSSKNGRGTSFFKKMMRGSTIGVVPENSKMTPPMKAAKANTWGTIGDTQRSKSRTKMPSRCNPKRQYNGQHDNSDRGQ